MVGVFACFFIFFTVGFGCFLLLISVFFYSVDFEYFYILGVIFSVLDLFTLILGVFLLFCLFSNVFF